MIKGVIIFTDISGSSKLWNKYKNRFYKKLQTLTEIIETKIKTYNGMVVKLLGDSHMIYFDDKNILNSLNFVFELQKYLYEKNFNINGEKIQIRIGYSYGKMNKIIQPVQKCKLIDFYGNNVNISSRLESLISTKGGIAIRSNNIKKYINKINPDIREFIKDKYIIEFIDYDIPSKKKISKRNNNKNNTNNTNNTNNIKSKSIKIKKTSKYLSLKNQLEKHNGVILDDIYSFKLKDL